MGFSLPGDKAANARPAYRSLRRPRGSALTDVGNHEPHRFEALVRRLLYDFRRPGRKRAGHARAGRARRGMFWKARLCRGGLLQCVSLHPAVSFAKKAVLYFPNASLFRTRSLTLIVDTAVSLARQTMEGTSEFGQQRRFSPLV